MSHSPRPHSLFIFLAVAAGTLSFSAVLFAQTESKPATGEKAQTSSGPQKPVHKPHTVITNDSIVHLAERSAPHTVEPATAEPVTETAKEANAPAEDPAQRKAEIASLEKQIKDKQQRVELLMRLFVTDEKAFLKDPLNPSEEPSVQERRRYEQDELRFEAAEVARLRAKLDALKAMPAQ